jgi:hypothetical protein
LLAGFFGHWTPFNLFSPDRMILPAAPLETLITVLLFIGLVERGQGRLWRVVGMGTTHLRHRHAHHRHMLREGRGTFWRRQPVEGRVETGQKDEEE